MNETFVCPRCQAGASRLRLIGASPAKMEERKVFLACTDCNSRFTLRGNGLRFNIEVLRVGNNKGSWK
jgi:hypothetical protein